MNFFQIMPLFLEIVVIYAGLFFLVYCFTSHFLGCYWTALDWSFIAIIKFPFDCSLEVLQIVINYFIDNWNNKCESVPNRERVQSVQLVKFTDALNQTGEKYIWWNSEEISFQSFKRVMMQTESMKFKGGNNSVTAKLAEEP